VPGLIRGIARTAAIAGTATAVSNGVSRRQAGRWAAQEQQQQPQYAEQPVAAAPPPPAADAPDMETKLAQLKDLGALKDQGVLSEAEFQEQKTRILNA
jgi:hypothetical protein